MKTTSTTLALSRGRAEVQAIGAEAERGEHEQRQPRQQIAPP
jgi:hypothetical protein